jgi:hypothetical protein
MSYSPSSSRHLDLEEEWPVNNSNTFDKIPIATFNHIGGYNNMRVIDENETIYSCLQYEHCNHHIHYGFN